MENTNVKNRLDASGDMEKTNAQSVIKGLFKDFISAGLAGAFIGVGGTAFLSAQSKIAGALFFAIGLFAVCLFKLNLFTGKLCYALENGRFYILRLAVILIGNFVGAATLALLLCTTRLGEGLKTVATPIVEGKLAGGWLSTFVLSVLCNALIYFAVEGYSKAQNGALKLAALIFGVSVFVLCGFEHCVANAFYISVCGKVSLSVVKFLFFNVLGNIAGGILTRALFKFISEKTLN